MSKEGITIALRVAAVVLLFAFVPDQSIRIAALAIMLWVAAGEIANRA